MNWNPFRKKQPKIDLPPDIEVWSVGDLAECMIKTGWNVAGGHEQEPGPSFGDIREVKIVRTDMLADGAQTLQFARWPHHNYIAANFRKIVSHAEEAQSCDEEFLSWIRQIGVSAK